MKRCQIYTCEDIAIVPIEVRGRVFIVCADHARKESREWIERGVHVTRYIANKRTNVTIFLGTCGERDYDNSLIALWRLRTNQCQR